MNFSPNNLYHVYNRGNNKRLIFPAERNYQYFKNKIRKELKGFCEVLAFCLMPNHFHLLIYIPSDSPGLLKSAGQSQQKLARKLGTILSSYSQAINKQEKTTGSLFQQKTKAKAIDTELYGVACLHYIHQNPLRAKLVNHLEDWKFSSFNEYFRQTSHLCNLSLAFELLNIHFDKERFYKESYKMIPDQFFRLEKIVVPKLTRGQTAD